MTVSILTGDCRTVLASMPDASVDCIVTSPPYFGLRDYGVAGQIGLEPTPTSFVETIVDVFREARRVLRADGTAWLNLGDSYTGSPPGTKRGVSGSSTLAGVKSERYQRTLEQSVGTVRDKSKLPGLKPKDLIGIPWRVAFALQEDGWFLRSDIIWSKPNPMPESVTDRPTSAHEHVFLLAKSERYYFDAAAVREAESVPHWDNGTRVFGGKNKHGANAVHGERTTGRLAVKRKRGTPPRHVEYASSDQSGLDEVGRGAGRNIRNVWTIATRPFAEAHFATFPPELVEPCVKAGCPVGGTVLDPFFGAGTTGLVADRLRRHCIGIELNPDYAAMARRRLERDAGMFASFAETAA